MIKILKIAFSPKVAAVVIGKGLVATSWSVGLIIFFVAKDYFFWIYGGLLLAIYLGFVFILIYVMFYDSSSVDKWEQTTFKELWKDWSLSSE